MSSSSSVVSFSSHQDQDQDQLQDQFHALRRPYNMRPSSPYQWSVPAALANASINTSTSTNMFDATDIHVVFPNISSKNNSNSSNTSLSLSDDTFQEVPDVAADVAAAVSGKDWAFRCLLVVLFCLCAKPRIPDERYHHHRRRRRNSRSRKEESPKVREARVEQSLTVKKVLTADAQGGGLTLGEPSPPPSILMTDTNTNTESHSDADAGDDAGDDHSVEGDDEENDETSTCIICLEPFRVGDTVAWSKQQSTDNSIPSRRAGKEAAAAAAKTSKAICLAEQQPPPPLPPPCLHVFHHDCIVPWLTNPQHNDCPACRSIILRDRSPSPRPTSHDYTPACPDESTTTSLEDEDDENEYEHDLEAALNNNSNDSIPFVIIHGLVSRVHHASCSLIGQSVDVNATTAAGKEGGDDDDNDNDDRLSGVI